MKIIKLTPTEQAQAARRRAAKVRARLLRFRLRNSRAQAARLADWTASQPL